MDKFEIVRTQIRYIHQILSVAFLFFVVGGIQHNDDDENWEQIGASNDVNEFERSFSSEFWI